MFLFTLYLHLVLNVLKIILCLLKSVSCGSHIEWCQNQRLICCRWESNFWGFPRNPLVHKLHKHKHSDIIKYTRGRSHFSCAFASRWRATRTCTCCSCAWPRPCDIQRACRIHRCCKQPATPRFAHFPTENWFLGKWRKISDLKSVRKSTAHLFTCDVQKSWKKTSVNFNTTIEKDVWFLPWSVGKYFRTVSFGL